jgi:hypothetical protein
MGLGKEQRFKCCQALELTGGVLISSHNPMRLQTPRIYWNGKQEGKISFLIFAGCGSIGSSIQPCLGPLRQRRARSSWSGASPPEAPIQGSQGHTPPLPLLRPYQRRLAERSPGTKPQLDWTHPPLWSRWTGDGRTGHQKRGDHRK